MSWFAGKLLGKKISVRTCVCALPSAVESFDKPPYCHNNISPFGFLRSLYIAICGV